MRALRIAFAAILATSAGAGPAAADDAKIAASTERAPIELDSPVRLKAGEAYIDTSKHVAHTGPLLHDWDADGKPDLLVGNFAGHIQYFRNTGTRHAPLFEDKGLLQADGETLKIPNW
jgi:hypothetical protein